MTESTAGCGLPWPPKLAMAIGNWLAPTPLTSMRIWPLASPERSAGEQQKGEAEQ